MPCDSGTVAMSDQIPIIAKSAILITLRLWGPVNKYFWEFTKIFPLVPFDRSDIYCNGKKIISVFLLRTEDFVHFIRERKKIRKVFESKSQS